MYQMFVAIDFNDNFCLAIVTKINDLQNKISLIIVYVLSRVEVLAVSSEMFSCAM